MREESGRKSRQSAGGGTRGSHSKRSIFRRTVFLMAVCGVLMFIPLFWKLWNIAIVNHDYYQQLATKQQTLDLSVSSSRGNIYDRNGNVLAMSATVYNLILSPNDLEKSVSKKDFTDEEGNLEFRTEALESDAMYDEIGSVLRIKQLRAEKKELLESLELYYRVFFLGEDAEESLKEGEE